MARMRRACLASAVRAASARNCEILKSWCVISIADMLPAPRINDMLHRVTVAVVWESPQESGSQAAGIRFDKNVMPRFVVGEDRSQSTLFPERLDDYVPGSAGPGAVQYIDEN